MGYSTNIPDSSDFASECEEMIFSIKNHISLIIQGKKTQTRRPFGRYQVGKTYSLQFGRGKKGIPIGRILILEKWDESPHDISQIPEEDYWAEGAYSCTEYEELYESMYPNWKLRTAYEFKYVPQSSSGTT